MYIIVVYDVDESLCSKYMKVLRKYLFHTQKSVFEGEITTKDFKRLQNELVKIDKNEDVLFYVISSKKALSKVDINNNLISLTREIII